MESFTREEELMVTFTILALREKIIDYHDHPDQSPDQDTGRGLHHRHQTSAKLIWSFRFKNPLISEIIIIIR